MHLFIKYRIIGCDKIFSFADFYVCREKEVIV